MSISKINKAFDKKFVKHKLFDKGVFGFEAQDIKDFYTQQILVLIEELEGKLPKKIKVPYIAERQKGFNIAIDQMRASIKSFLK